MMKGTEVPNPPRSVPHRPRLHVSCNLGIRQEPGSASLPCITVAVRRGAGAKKDSMRFRAILLWITAGSSISHLVPTRIDANFKGGGGGATPCVRREAPRAPLRFLRQYKATD